MVRAFFSFSYTYVHVCLSQQVHTSQYPILNAPLLLSPSPSQIKEEKKKMTTFEKNLSKRSCSRQESVIYVWQECATRETHFLHPTLHTPVIIQGHLLTFHNFSHSLFFREYAGICHVDELLHRRRTRHSLLTLTFPPHGLDDDPSIGHLLTNPPCSPCSRHGGFHGCHTRDSGTQIMRSS
ncbi:hypothetical protein BDZ85DRAFT_261248 [Elsinoe ampelina]|uniref:Uncharacterized protein n=1 Tax=Elsinoe ampelina TaxID=302913 RepID=A0A6A6GGH3_9PEZI|nr:hypothetical protein BDZ85DRAFT_261248 [Elsinoe ampelina]